MRFSIKTDKQSLLNIMRSAGYAPEGQAPSGEYRFARPARSYPRFHIYCRDESSAASCNLHLDQKRPSYRGSAAHGGEYDGPTVEREAQRILAIASN